MAKLKFLILLKNKKLYCKYKTERSEGELYGRRARLRHLLALLRGEYPKNEKRRIRFFNRN